jgi:hypothetical protein
MLSSHKYKKGRNMDKRIKLLVLEEKEPLRHRSLGFKLDRSKTLNAIKNSGAKVHHDSGGRLIVVNTEKVEKELMKLLPGAKLIPIDEKLSEAIADLDLEPSESLFIEALKIRSSKSFREAKKKRKPGESPEEKEMFSGPCVRDEY